MLPPGNGTGACACGSHSIPTGHHGVGLPLSHRLANKKKSLSSEVVLLSPLLNNVSAPSPSSSTPVDNPPLVYENILPLPCPRLRDSTLSDYKLLPWASSVPSAPTHAPQSALPSPRPRLGCMSIMPSARLPVLQTPVASHFRHICPENASPRPAALSFLSAQTYAPARPENSHGGRPPKP